MREISEKVTVDIKEIAFNAINKIADEVHKFDLDLHDSYSAILFCLALGTAAIIDSFNEKCGKSIDHILNQHISMIKKFIKEVKDINKE